MISKTERDELRRVITNNIGNQVVTMGISPRNLEFILDSLDMALAEKEHYKTLAETCGEQRDAAERKLAEVERANKEMIGEILQEDEFIKKVLS